MPGSVATAPSRICRLGVTDFLRDTDIRTDELVALLNLADDVKRSPRDYTGALGGQSVVLMFEKPSLRTRCTFEIGIHQLGGHPLQFDGPIGGREPLKDIARNFARWTGGIVARTFKQSTLDELAKWSSVPVINALSDLYHPCQALADTQALRERFGELRGLKVAFVGDGTNVAHSLLLCMSRLGVHFSFASPAGYLPNPDILDVAQGFAKVSGGSITLTLDPVSAVKGANAVYTDIWVSMGWEAETSMRHAAFREYQVNSELMSNADPSAVFMHCLPATRGEEVTDEVIESKQSIVFDQAENRLHAQKALMIALLGRKDL
jgi:ornithine carbamoyltransferase